MNLSKRLHVHWQKEFADLNRGNTHLLLAVSGGVDSVVLTHLIKEAGFSYSIAHCNFQLRGAESERDALFVASLASDGEFYSVRFETQAYADQHKMAIQEAARKLRYEWFEELIKEIQARADQAKPGEALFAKKTWLVTAHHADDNIETVLMNFFRGTGIQGLRGILPYQKSKAIIRPLLPFRKQELVDFAKEAGLEFVEDQSNRSDKYTRNFFRNQLIPQIQKVFPETEENILQHIDKLREVAQIYQEAIQEKLELLLFKKGNEYQVPILKLKQQQTLSTVVWELSKPFGFSAGQTVEIIKLMDADNGASISSEDYRIIKNRKWLIIAPKAINATQHYIINEANDSFEFSAGVLEMKWLPAIANLNNKDTDLALIDSKNIQFPLYLRKPRTGDYFYPLGMQKKKKLSRFLIDLKLSKTQKEACWVLECNKKIVWILGYRIDDRFKVSADATKILQIRFKRTTP